MSERSFASAEYAINDQRLRREKLLGHMECVVPWVRLALGIELLYPPARRVGHQPIGVSRLLRSCCLRQRCGLADKALQDALLGNQAPGKFVSVDLSCESGPNVVDEFMLAPPSTPRNEDNKRYLEIPQIEKCNQWHFGIEVYIGVDAASSLVRRVIARTNVKGVTPVSAVLHGYERAATVSLATALCTSGRTRRD